MRYLATSIVLTILSTSTYAAKTQKVLFCDDPFPPFSRIGDSGIIEGPSIQFLKEVFKRIKTPLSVKRYPWKRLMLNLRNGNCDGVNFILKNKERERFLYFTTPIFAGRKLCVLSISNKERFPQATLIDFEWETLDDFSILNNSGLREHHYVGSFFGYARGKKFEDAIKNGKIRTIEVSQHKQSLQMLMAGRIPLVLMSADLLVSTLQNMESNAVETDFHCARKGFKLQPYYMAISKQSKWLKKRESLISEINTAINGIKQEGEHAIKYYLPKASQNREYSVE